MGNLAQIRSEPVAVQIGGIPILLRTDDREFRELLETRYAGFVNDSMDSPLEFKIDLAEPRSTIEAGEDVRVRFHSGSWFLRRGDFRAEWDPRTCKGRIHQTRSPYAIDSVLRIVHTLILAKSGGFLVHAASAIRHGRAFLFAGISGAGKTTISRLAPPDAILLTDEISYVRKEGTTYLACGTPFAGELGKAGQNQSAPLVRLFLLEKGPECKTEAVPRGEAVRSLLRNILFFAEDGELVKRLFQSACEFVERVPVERLTFVPDQRVWQMVGQIALEGKG